jgi:hypothetical protein
MSWDTRLQRIYHPYQLWEDYKAGFYDIPSTKEKEVHKEKVVSFFRDTSRTEHYMRTVIKEWVVSFEHNFSNNNMNRVAYLGQAAVCLGMGIPCISTMYAWKFLSQNEMNLADCIAIKNIKKWDQKRRLEIISKLGKAEVMMEGYQTKLPLF